MTTKHKPNKLNLSQVNKLISQSKYHLSDIGDAVNSIFYVLDKKQQIVYMNKKAKLWLEPDASEKESWKQLKISDYLEDQLAYLEYKDEDNSGSVIRCNLKKVWFPAELDYKLCLISAYPVSNSPRSLHTIRPLKDWEHLKKRLESLIEEEEFIQTNTEKYDLLTNREKEVLNLVADGLNSKEISDELNISKYTVEQHRKNARKKLGAMSLAEMTKFGRVFS